MAVCACVDSDGLLDEFVRVDKITVKLQRDREGNRLATEQLHNPAASADRRRKLDDLATLEALVVEKKPAVIVIAAENKDALNIYDDVKQLLRDLDERDKTGRWSETGVELVDNQLARVYETSRTGEAEFGTQMPGVIKQAVCLARQLQDPLLCYAQLCNVERDLLALKLHPMQQAVLAGSGSRKSQEANELQHLLDLEFVNVVNEVGVDLNRCNQAPHTAHCLQFVCGLGPRKAQYILKVLRQQRVQLNDKPRSYPVATSRLFLITNCGFGKRILINSVGFFKFDVDKIERELEAHADTEDTEHDIEILDSTRIHMETYEWARKICIDALDFEDNNDLANSKSAIREIVYENAKPLKDLDMDAFAAELERTGHGNKAITLNDIKNELCSRYRDRRTPYTPMSDEERFYCMCKESKQTLYVGKLVMARITGIARKRPNKEQLDEANPLKDEHTCMWVCSFCQRGDFNDLSKVWSHFDSGECPGPAVGVRAQLDNGCQGFIPLKFISDHGVKNPEDRIKPGMTVYARLRRIEPERFSVELTTKTSDLRDIDDQWKPAKDQYYDFGAHSADHKRVGEKQRRTEHKQTYTKRVIAHPQFKNIGYQQAVAMLSEMEIGDAIIRPSSKVRRPILFHTTTTLTTTTKTTYIIYICLEKIYKTFLID